VTIVEAVSVTIPLAALPYSGAPIAQIETTSPILAAALRAVEQGERRMRSTAQGGGTVSTARLTPQQVVLLRAYLLQLPRPETISQRRARAEAVETLTKAMP
jgi:hypothetical protein